MATVRGLGVTNDAESALAYIIGTISAIWHEGTFLISRVFGIILISFGLAIYAAPTFAAILTERGWVNASPGTTSHNFFVWGAAVSSLWIVGTLKKLNFNSIIERVTGIKMAIKSDVTEITITDDQTVVKDERKAS